MQSRLVVLVVEDEPLLMMVAVEMIAELGFEVIEARHADEAIAVMEKRQDVHVVFSDVHMPGSMDGLKLAHYVRHRWPPTKILTTSGKARLAVAELPSGGRFIQKPYTATDLGIALHAIIAA
ncbi:MULTISPECIES: response regulator [Bradyrhizobium]|jgi:CheY-like chemotaxis protein|uniref:response regulator n=1 Tax=Bradyrhizobium TaxID=374 RepID=UPI001E64F642|nr:response regulator [Bradyrhizobium canariense]MBM7485938.1 CheY-like chemotaxis protein [Bradyrhizobium canariense]UFW73035.1 response regulator [Bradyrhizobium canariense]